ncbi:MAG: hypothetical protein WCX69_03630 [Candidatus Paceibacterota bacterium]
MSELIDKKVEPFEDEEIESLCGKEKLVNDGLGKRGNLKRFPSVRSVDALLAEPLYRCG